MFASELKKEEFKSDSLHPGFAAFNAGVHASSLMSEKQPGQQLITAHCEFVHCTISCKFEGACIYSREQFVLKGAYLCSVQTGLHVPHRPTAFTASNLHAALSMFALESARAKLIAMDLLLMLSIIVVAANCSNGV